MLRGTVLLIGGAALAAGLVALVAGACSPALVFGLWGALLLIGTIYERVRYKPLLAQAPGPGWKRRRNGSLIQRLAGRSPSMSNRARARGNMCRNRVS